MINKTIDIAKDLHRRMGYPLGKVHYRDQQVELGIAARTWKPQVLDLLINTLRYPIQINRYGLNLLHTAIESTRKFAPHRRDPQILPSSFPKTIRFLISQGVDVNWRDEKGATPLHYTVKDHSRGLLKSIEEPLMEVVGILLDAGADGGAVDRYGKNMCVSCFPPPPSPPPPV